MRSVGLIAVIGRPNSGKSTLLNHLLGEELSIVTPKAQTTRKRILGVLTDEKFQAIFVDTPGIHRAQTGGINEAMVAEAREGCEADVIWYLVDPHSSPFHEQVVLDLIRHSSAPLFLVLNKIDLIKENPFWLNELEKTAREHGIRVQKTRTLSAKTGDGVKALLAESWPLFKQGPLLFPDPDVLSDQPIRFFVSEKVREQLYLQLGEELPYSCAVQVESMDESKIPVRIQALIYVERESQKGIVIGAKGKKIKAIGELSRKKIETMLQNKVYLELKVKVLPNWTRDREKLKQMGFAL